MRLQLNAYRDAAGPDVIEELRKLAPYLAGKRVVHVNSTRMGGGVAEILMWQIPLMQDLGIEARWETVLGDAEFFAITKSLHNALQGQSTGITARQMDHYRAVNRENAAKLREVLEAPRELPRAPGQVDLEVPHRCEPSPSPRVEVRPRAGQRVRREHLLAGSLRAASSTPAISDPAQH
jgi:hypothetical protein